MFSKTILQILYYPISATTSFTSGTIRLSIPSIPAFKVTDDDGNVIIIKAEELELMGDAVKTIGGGDDTLICG